MIYIILTFIGMWVLLGWLAALLAAHIDNTLLKEIWLHKDYMFVFTVCPAGGPFSLLLVVIYYICTLIERAYNRKDN